MKYYIIAGERSGDLHASNLVKSIKKTDSKAEFLGIGGSYLASAGVKISVDYSEIALMGFWEVFKNLSRMRQHLKACKEDILEYAPDAIILVDFGGFNMRIAKFCHNHQIKTCYYISPKVWAWNQKRALKIKRYVDHMFVILPFETTFFEKFGYKVDYVGNPLFDAIRNFVPNQDFRKKHALGDKPIIAILPGSRKQEVTNILSTMLKVVDRFPDYHFIVAGVSNLEKEVYAEAEQTNGLSIIYESTYDLLSIGEAAVVTSGTATLETALFNVPQIVCYKTSNITYRIAKHLISVKYISLVNLIADKKVVTELIQGELSSANLERELKRILTNQQERRTMLDEYRKIKNILGETSASENTAALMQSYLGKS